MVKSCETDIIVAAQTSVAALIRAVRYKTHHSVRPRIEIIKRFADLSRGKCNGKQNPQRKAGITYKCNVPR